MCYVYVIGSANFENNVMEMSSVIWRHLANAIT